MFKKILLISLCLILSACGNTDSVAETPTSEKPPMIVESFGSSYNRIIRSTLEMSSTGMIWMINNFYSILYPSGYDTSLIRFAFHIPEMTSGDISLSADAVRETYKKLSAKMSLTGSVTNTQGESIEFRDVRGQLVIHAEKSRYYGILEALDITWIPLSMVEDFEEITTYIGKWWVFDYIDMVSSTISSNQNFEGGMGSILTAYTSLVQDISENGTKNIIPLLEKNPILIASSSGTVGESEYIYPVILSQSGILTLLQAISVSYSSTGIAPDIKKELEEALATITSTGELRVSRVDPTYFSLMLHTTLSGGVTPPTDIEIQRTSAGFNMKAVNQSGSLISTYTQKAWEKSRYVLSLSEWEESYNIIEYAGTLTRENIDANFVFFHSDTKNTLSTTLKYTESDGTFAYTMNQSKAEKFQDILDISWIYTNGKVTALTGSFSIPESPKERFSLTYTWSDDDTFWLTIQTPFGDLDSDGSLKKDDLKINLSAKWFTATLEHKKSSDGWWNGKIQLPVWLIQWNGKIENEILRDLHIKWTSPFAGINLDLIQKDDTVIWPYSLTMEGKEKSNGTITLRKIPKNFDIRVDTLLPNMSVPSFFEFHNFTDLRWDKNAKVIEPENADSLAQLLQKNTNKIPWDVPIGTPYSDTTRSDTPEFTDL